MTTNDQDIDLQKLTDPFPQQAIRTRQGGGGKALAYVATHTVIHRLNDATGNHWDFRLTRLDWHGDLLIAVGELTIPGLGTRTGIGVQKVIERAGEDLVKGAASDCLKKCATLFGVGIELYGPDYEAGEAGEVADTSHPAHEAARQKAMARLHALGAERGLDHDDLHDLACARFGVASLKALDTAQIAILTGWVSAYDHEGGLTITYYAKSIINASTYVALQKIGAELKGNGIDDEGLREAFRRRLRDVKQPQPDTNQMLPLAAPEREHAGEAGNDRFTG